MNRTFDLLWLRIREYFKHPAEDLRQARPIVPGRLYSNFGYICKAVPLNHQELSFLKDSEGKSAVAAPILENISKRGNFLSQLRDLQEMPGVVASGVPCRCNFCHLYRESIPCPFYNQLADGSTVCDTHKYVILKNQR